MLEPIKTKARQYVPFGSTGVSVDDDTSTCQFTKLFKLAGEPLLIDVPAQIAHEQVPASSIVAIGHLFELFGGRDVVDLGLALLGCSFLAIIVIVIFRRVLVRIRRVIFGVGFFGVVFFFRIVIGRLDERQNYVRVAMIKSPMN